VLADTTLPEVEDEPDDPISGNLRTVTRGVGGENDKALRGRGSYDFRATPKSPVAPSPVQ